MGLNIVKRQPGFLPFGSSDPDVIFSKSLKSASDLPDGATFSGSEETYDSVKGLNFGATSNRLDVLAGGDGTAFTQAQREALNYGGHISFEVSRSFLDSLVLPDAVRYAFHLRFTDNNVRDIYLSHNSGSGENQVTSTGTNGNAELDAYNRDDMGIVHVSCTNSRIDFYVDYILAASIARTNTAAKPLTVFFLGGRTNTFRTDETAYFRNLQVSTRPIQLPVSAVINNMCSIGDSISVQMQYPSELLGILGYTGTGYGDNSVEAGTAKNDSGAHTTVHRLLAEKGVYMGGKINSYGRVSCRVSHTSNTLDERTTVLLADTASEYPTPSQRNNCTDLISFIGTNDIAASVAVATWKAAYQTEITAWIAAGIQRIYLCKLIGRLDGFDSAIEEYNVAINELAAANSDNCFVVEPPEEMKAGSITSTYLTDDVHPNNLGQRLIGESIFPIVYANAA